MLNSKPETANTQTSTTSHPPNVHRLSKQVANATKPLSSSSSAAGLPRPSAARGGVAKLPPKGASKLSVRKSPKGGRSGSHKELFDGNVRKSGSFGSRGRHLSDTYTKESAYGRSTGGNVNNLTTCYFHISVMCLKNMCFYHTIKKLIRKLKYYRFVYRL